MIGIYFFYSSMLTFANLHEIQLMLIDFHLLLHKPKYQRLNGEVITIHQERMWVFF